MDNLCHLTDDELVKSYSAGCNEAFDALLFRHKDALYNYISYNLNDSPSIVDDVFQETFVKVIVTLREGRYASCGNFGAWLIRIAHNVIVDHYRRDAQLPVVCCLEDDKGLFNDQHIVETYAEARLVNEQTLHDVKSLMEQLPDVQRDVVYMRYYENRSFKEIASLTGASVNTCLGRMRYALLNMRRMAQERRLSLELIL